MSSPTKDGQKAAKPGLLRRFGRPRQNAKSNTEDPAATLNSKILRELDSDEAEATLISNLEKRANSTVPGSDGFRPAVQGERAPLRIETLGKAFSEAFSEEEPTPLADNAAPKRQSFKDVAENVRTMQRSASHRRQMSTPSQGSERNGHRRAHTLLASIEESSGIGSTDFSYHMSSDTFGLKKESNFHGLDMLWNSGDDTDEEEFGAEIMPSTSTEDSMINNDVRAEGLPLLNGESMRYSDYTSVTGRRKLARQTKMKRSWKKVKDCMNPMKIIQRLGRWISTSCLLVAMPLFAAAWFLFYYFGNPDLDFLPGNATLSWWFDFFGRQLLLCELSRIIQFILIDCFTLSSRFFVRIFGSWVTIFCLQSKGWPFVVGCWGLLAMIFLHGNNTFQQHWLYFTGIRIYSLANSGSYILASNGYLRILLGMILAGVATTTKRTLLTLYFGKRSFETYKPKLEVILNHIIIISEVAELAAEADSLPADDSTSIDTNHMVDAALKSRGSLNAVRWSSVKFKKDGKGRSRLDSEGEEPSELDGSFDQADEGRTNDGRPLTVSRARSLSRIDRDSSGRLRIKNLLDRWEEPVNKLDKSTGSTVNDVLKFRRALTYMDLEHPFSEAFGPASTRDELIVSAQNVYIRLQKLAPGSTVLPYSVLTALSENEDGTVDNAKKRSLRNLFRPDSGDDVTQLAFIQSCDTVYKRLRYFRASVGNASVIDKVLEGIIDAVFGFVLALLILSLLQFNPWPLLVSMSTLLVTFAFAVGPSAAKAIEGIFLIVSRRPFDIGDRIIISDSPGALTPGPGVSNSWFVEDISLFSTTLRFAASNEVSTVSNGSIASARITNCARSKNATVHLLLKLHISLHEDNNLDLFREALENYARDNPNIWESIVFFRCEEIDSDNEFVTYDFAVRSRQSWQVSPRVLQDRARLHQFCVELAAKLNVKFDSPDPRRVLYYGGSLVEGAVKDYKKDLLSSPNVHSANDLESFLVPGIGSGDVGPLLRPEADEIDKGKPLSGTAVNEHLSNQGGALREAGTEETIDATNNLFLSMLQGSHG